MFFFWIPSLSYYRYKPTRSCCSNTRYGETCGEYSLLNSFPSSSIARGEMYSNISLPRWTLLPGMFVTIHIINCWGLSWGGDRSASDVRICGAPSSPIRIVLVDSRTHISDHHLVWGFISTMIKVHHSVKLVRVGRPGETRSLSQETCKGGFGHLFRL